MTDVIMIDNLESGAVVVQLKFLIRGDYLKTCDTSGTFCVQDFGIFPVSVARILKKSKVSLIFKILPTFETCNLTAVSLFTSYIRGFKVISIRPT